MLPKSGQAESYDNESVLLSSFSNMSLEIQIWEIVGGLPQESILRILGPERGTGEDWLQAPLLLILDTCHL